MTGRQSNSETAADGTQHGQAVEHTRLGVDSKTHMANAHERPNTTQQPSRHSFSVKLAGRRLDCMRLPVDALTAAVYAQTITMLLPLLLLLLL